MEEQTCSSKYLGIKCSRWADGVARASHPHTQEAATGRSLCEFQVSYGEALPQKVKLN